jgi:hypothetical protein
MNSFLLSLTELSGLPCSPIRLDDCCDTLFRQCSHSDNAQSSVTPAGTRPSQKPSDPAMQAKNSDFTSLVPLSLSGLILPRRLVSNVFFDLSPMLAWVEAS